MVKGSYPWNGVYEIKYINGIETFGLQRQDKEHMFLEFRDLGSRDMEIIGNVYKLPKNE